MLWEHCLSVCLSVLSVMLVYCGQTVRWIKMKLGVQVGLGSSHIVLDWDPAPPPPPPKGHKPLFWPTSVAAIMAGWIKMLLDRQVGLSPFNIVLDGDPAPLPKKETEPPNFPLVSIVAKWLDGSRCHLLCRRPQSRPHCVTWGPSSPIKGLWPPIFGTFLLLHISVVANRLDRSRFHLVWR